MNRPSEYTYDVFISYRHKPLDEAVTRGTFNRLESYRLPKPILKKGGAPIHRVFRDTEELAVSKVLTDTIMQALRETRCLVVVCSTDTPSSAWVDREVASFIEMGKAGDIFPLLISGTPETSFPDSLKLVPDISERIMDVRTGDADARRILAKEETALLPVIARTAGCSYKDLLREHSFRKRRRTLTGWAAGSAVFALVALVSLTFWTRAENYRAGAGRVQDRSMRMLESMTYPIPDALVGFTGTYPRVARILEDNTAQINDILALATDKTEVEPDIAANCEKLATSYTTLGYFDKAQEAQQKAIDIWQKRKEEQLPGAETALASAWNNMGRQKQAAGKYAESEKYFRLSLEELPDTEENRILRATVLSNLGAVRVEQGDYQSAGEFFSESGELFEQDTAASGIVRTEYASCVYNYGAALHRAGQYEKAQSPLEKGTELFETIYAGSPVQNNLLPLLRARSALGANLSQLARFDEAMQVFGKADLEAQKLTDAGNIEISMLLAELYNQYGFCCNMQGLTEEADINFRRSTEAYLDIAQRTGSDTAAANAALACFNVGINAFQAGDYSSAPEYLQKGLYLLEPVMEEMGNYYASLYWAWHAFYALTFDKNETAALEESARALTLQPDSVIAAHYYGYALMYNGYEEDAARVFEALAALGQGTIDNLRLDFDALSRYGMHHALMDKVMAELS